MLRRACLAMLACGLLSMPPAHAAAAAPGAVLEQVTTAQAVSLRSIAGWLSRHGAEGFIGGDVADQLGIPRAAGETRLEARMRGFKRGEVVRVAQVPVDGRGEFLLFMVQEPHGEVSFYFSTVREGLRKAFVSLPQRGLVVPMERAEAERRFREEVRYWGDRIGSN